MKTLVSFIQASLVLTASFSTCMGAGVLYGNSVDLGGNSSHSSQALLGNRITVDQSVNLQAAGIIFRTTGYNGNVGLYSSAVGSGLPNILMATTGKFAVTQSGRTEIPFSTAITLSPGTYWFMAIYDASASIGTTSVADTSNFTAFTGLNVNADLPSPIVDVITYSGKQFNYYLVTEAIPEPNIALLLLISGMAWICRRNK